MTQRRRPTVKAADIKYGVIYVRVSTKEQALEGYSLRAQEEACRNYAKEQGWSVLEVFVEAGASAYNAGLDRPVFNKMLAFIEAQPQPVALIVWKLDRFCRYMEDFYVVRPRLWEMRAILRSATEQIDDSPSGNFNVNIKISQNQYESENHAVRVQLGLDRKFAEGGWPGMAKVGYRNVRDAAPVGAKLGRARIEPDPAMAPLVLKLFELYALGTSSLRALQEESIRIGLRTRFGKPIALSYLAEMLHDEFYIGVMTYKKQRQKGNHQPIVPKALFDRVQDVSRQRDQAGERLRTHFHPLKGVLLCHTCESRLSLTMAKGNGGVFPYFFCIGRHKKSTDCAEPYSQVDVIERDVDEIYEIVQLKPEKRKRIEGKLVREIERTARSGGPAKKQLERRLRELAGRRDRFIDAYGAKIITLDDLNKRLTEVDGQLVDCEADLASWSGRAGQAEELLEIGLKLLARCNDAYRTADPQDRKEWNRVLFAGLGVHQRRVVRVDPSPLLSALVGAGSNKTTLVEASGFEPPTSALRTQPGGYRTRRSVQIRLSSCGNAPSASRWFLLFLDIARPGRGPERGTDAYLSCKDEGVNFVVGVASGLLVTILVWAVPRARRRVTSAASSILRWTTSVAAHSLRPWREYRYQRCVRLAEAEAGGRPVAVARTGKHPVTVTFSDGSESHYFGHKEMSAYKRAIHEGRLPWRRTWYGKEPPKVRCCR